MQIRITDDYELRPTQNELDWQVFERRVIGKPQNPKQKSREGEEDWVALPSFHRDVDGAVSWIRKHAPRAKWRAVEADMEGYLEIMREIERDMARHAKAFEKAAKAAKAVAS